MSGSKVTATTSHPEDSPPILGFCKKPSCPTHDEAKKKTIWFTDKARINCSLGFDDFMIVVTIFVLFGDEIHTLVGGIYADPPFDALMSVAFFLFLIELMVYSWTKTTIEWKPSSFSNFFQKICCNKTPDFTIKGYLFGFYFWLDFLAVVSMLPEVSFIAKGLKLDVLGAANNVGTAGKLGRVARMVRLVRLVKLYKTGAKRLEMKAKEAELLELLRLGVINLDEFQERKDNMDSDNGQTKVGAELSDTTTRRVIAIVLAMLCFVPLLSVTEVNRAPHILTGAIQKYNSKHDTWNLLTAVTDIKTFFLYATPQQTTNHIRETDPPFLVYLEIYPHYPDFDSYQCYEGTPTWQSPSKGIDSNKMASICLRKENYVGGRRQSDSYTSTRQKQMVNDVSKAPRAQLRPEEIMGELGVQGFGGGVHYDGDCCLSDDCQEVGPCYVRYKFNQKVELMDKALLSIIITLFVAFMLVVGAHTFTTDAERLVLTPIQEMMALVQRVSDDPSRPIESKGDGGQYETRKIENAIKKITDLLRIGFGVAGSDIVRENISSKSKASGGDIDLMGNPGKRIYSVFGFCMIEEFDHMTEKMEDKIMDFINDVAKVVHENVNNWGGQCNKNLGGSFLMTWKVNEHFTKGSLNVDVSRIPYIAKTADRALLGFIKVVADLNREPAILKYRNIEKYNITNEHNQSIPFKVCMGFGLHVGWGIEGPVGSLCKVDATYLSPHVNMAARCETAAKQWHMQILCTEIFYQCLSKAAQQFMRRLDKVMVKGSVVPMNMYTYDTFQDQDMVDKNDPALWKDDTFENYTRIESESYDPDTTMLWKKDPDLVRLRRHVFGEEGDLKGDLDIQQLHAKGVELYIQGDWVSAKDTLNVVDTEVGKNIKRICEERGVVDADLEHVNEGVLGDGASQTLLAYMAKACKQDGKRGQPPDDWDPQKGRALTSK